MKLSNLSEAKPVTVKDEDTDEVYHVSRSTGLAEFQFSFNHETHDADNFAKLLNHPKFAEVLQEQLKLPLQQTFRKLGFGGETWVDDVTIDKITHSQVIDD